MRPSRDDQRVAQYFDQRSSYWDRIYGEDSLEAQILLRRQTVALSWIDELSLPEGSRVLEIGCGAGSMTVRLAKRGYVVWAVDRSEAMAALTWEHAVTSGVGDVVAPIVGDTHRLMFPDGAFDLVVALGLLSWVRSPHVALDEMARITRPAGYVLVTSLNSTDFSRLLDPAVPAVRLLRRIASALGRANDQVRPTRYPSRHVRQLLHVSGLQPLKQTTVGFGPFTLLGKALLPDKGLIRVDEVLQRLADSKCRLFRSVGRLYLVITQKRNVA